MMVLGENYIDTTSTNEYTGVFDTPVANAMYEEIPFQSKGKRTVEEMLAIMTLCYNANEQDRVYLDKKEVSNGQ